MLNAAVILDSDFARRQLHEKRSQLDRLRQDFDSLRPEQATLLGEGPCGRNYIPDLELDSLGSSEFHEEYSKLLAHIVDCEVKVQHLKQENMECDNANMLLKGQTSHPQLLTDRELRVGASLLIHSARVSRHTP